MEHTEDEDSPERPAKKPRAPYGLRNGKGQPDAWQPPKEEPTGKRKKRSGGPQARGLKQPSGDSLTEARARSAVRREEIAATEVAAESKDSTPTLPAFEPVPRKFRHDGWTPARQIAFIGALADTGCVSRAARYVNMSPEGAYWLRRQKGSDSFRRAWEAALDLGVQRLKDECYERALEGQLVPVFIGGKLKGFKRVKNDRLLMFALRMNAKDEYGRRMAATYFDPTAARLHGGSGVSDGGERAKQTSPPPLAGGGLGGGVAPSSSSVAVGQQRLPSSSGAIGHQKLTITGPAVSRMRRDDRNAAIVAGFDPAAMSLPEIEAMQAMLVDAATRKRAEQDGPPEHMTGVVFLENRGVGAPGEDGHRPPGEFKALGPLEDIEPVVFEEDREAEFDEDEDRWWELE